MIIKMFPDLNVSDLASKMTFEYFKRISKDQTQNFSDEDLEEKLVLYFHDEAQKLAKCEQEYRSGFFTANTQERNFSKESGTLISLDTEKS